MTAVAVLLAIFSVPLAAILASTYLKAKRLNQEKADAEIHRKVRALEALTADLKGRVENLETIATSTDWDDLERAGSAPALPPKREDADLRAAVAATERAEETTTKA